MKAQKPSWEDKIHEMCDIGTVTVHADAWIKFIREIEKEAYDCGWYDGESSSCCGGTKIKTKDISTL